MQRPLVDRLFPFRVRREQPRWRLLCFPFAGGSAVTFRGWSERLPADIEVCPVELPGKGVRRTEPLVRDVEVVLDEIVPALDALQPARLALFGYSMGAQLAYRLSVRLGSRVEHLFIAASAPPQAARGVARSILSDAALLGELRALKGSPKEILDDPQWHPIILPVMRADFALAEAAARAPAVPISCDITAFAGARDPHASPATMDGWRRCTTRALHLQSFDAEHFFLKAHGDPMLTTIAQALAST